MSIIKSFFLLMLLFASTGCALQPAAPDSAELRALPVVRMGTARGSHNNYILFVPRGQMFHIELNIAGDLLTGQIHKVINTSLKQDVYLYQHWGSYDGKHWQLLHNMLGVGLSMGMDNQKAFIKVKLTEQEK